MSNLQVKRVGVVGTGMISRCFVRLIAKHYKDLVISKVFTRRSLNTISDFPLPECLTNSLDEVLDNSDLIVECSGDVYHGTEDRKSVV